MSLWSKICLILVTSAILFGIGFHCWLAYQDYTYQRCLRCATM